MTDTDTETARPNNESLEPEQKRKVFIGSLSYQIEESIFRDYWTKFGTVIEATILRDRDGHSRGFGFVTFADSSSVDAVMQARPHVLDNRLVETKRAVPREDSHKPNMQLSVKKLYLGGVKEPIIEDDLKEYFTKYGNIVSIIIMKDRDGRHRGYGFIEFDDYDPVDRVILEKTHIVCGRQLDVQKAQTRDGCQRSSNTRSRTVSLNTSGPTNYNRNYTNGNYPPNNFNSNYESMANNGNVYSSNMNAPNGNWTPFGEDYHQDPFSGPMRRSNMNGASTGIAGSRAYAPYNNNRMNGNRGHGGDGAGFFDNSGSSWTSWA